MNIPENQALEAASAMYSINSVMKPRFSAAPAQDNLPKTAEASDSLTTGASPVIERTALPELGRYINVWA